jgi:hypothetical protein
MVKPHSSIVCSSPAPSYLLQTPSSLHRWDFEGQVGSYYKSREVFQGETTFSTTWALKLHEEEKEEEDDDDDDGDAHASHVFLGTNTAQILLSNLAPNGIVFR